jgi:hypothetical protein
VDEAVQEGRSRLDLYRKSRVFGTPVLYLHSAGGLVIPKAPPDPKKQTSAAETSGVKDQAPATAGTSTTAPAATPAATAPPPPLARDVLDPAFGAGINAAQVLAEPNARIAMTQRLLKLKKDMANKGRTEVFNALYQTWAAEIDPTYKDVLLAVMEAVPSGG